MIDINFSVLCTIKISHEYYGDRPWSDFTIIPSKQTAQLLSNCKMIYRQQANKLIIGIQSVVDSSVSPPVITPFTPPSVYKPLTFFIRCDNSLFSNFTNIPLTAVNGKLFYFTNRNNNAVHLGSNSTYYLSDTIKPYSNSDNYTEGDMAVSAGTVYSAIQSISQTSPVDPPNSNFWRIINSSSVYVSQHDLLQLVPAIYNYPLGSIQNFAAYQVNGYNDVATPHDYSAVIVPLTTITFPASDIFKLDLSSLPTGKYDLIVNGLHNNIYLTNEFTGTGTCCGIIELYNENTLPAGYSYLDIDGNLISPPPVFSIYFLNRATIWKFFLTSTNNAVNIVDGNHVYQFSQPTTPTSPTTILSTSWIPLSETPINTLTLDGKVTPSATANRLSRNADDPTDTHYYSEIYLNY